MRATRAAPSRYGQRTHGRTERYTARAAGAVRRRGVLAALGHRRGPSRDASFEHFFPYQVWAASPHLEIRAPQDVLGRAGAVMATSTSVPRVRLLVGPGTLH